ncbi:MAG: metallophosphoesterase family protein [Thermomicrobiales bacterium]
MRIGLIADIHGNLLALDTVLAELARVGVDELICLGDVAALGPQPGAVIARLRALQCPVVMGNTDAWLLDPTLAEGSSAPVLVTSQWCMTQLSVDDLAYVRTFSPTLSRTLPDGTELLCFHGSPRSFDDAITATTPAETLDEMLAGADAAIMVGGHTHISMMRRHRGARIINTGSVGLPGIGAVTPYNRDVHWAEYAVLDGDGDHTAITLHRTPLDVAAMVRVAHASDMPESAWWSSLWRQQ